MKKKVIALNMLLGISSLGFSQCVIEPIQDNKATITMLDGDTYSITKSPQLASSLDINANCRPLDKKIAWNGAKDVYSEDGRSAVCGSSLSFESNYLFASNFDFKIPENHRVTGVKIEIKWYATEYNASRQCNVKVGLLEQGFKYGRDLSTDTQLPQSLTYTSFGGQYQSWGFPTTLDEYVRKPDFGVILSAYNTSRLGSSFRVDHIKMTVFIDPKPFITRIDHTNITCFGANNGTATVSAYKGYPPYSFSWDNGDNASSTSSASNLTAGTHGFIITDTNKCSSSSLTTPIVTEPDDIKGSQSITACNSATINGKAYTSSQVVVDILTAKNGCDSTVITNLTINKSATFSQNVTACNSTEINGKTYTSSQVVVDNLSTKKGCDSTVTTNLTINKSSEFTQSITKCNSAVINGKTYTSTQVIIDKLAAKNGCDSIITTNLTINKSATFSQNISACNSAVINGRTYTSSQTVVDKLTTKKGCDSTVITNLTINNPTTFTRNITACNSALINGKTYTSSQVVVDKLTTKKGCDSTVTTNLRINNSATFSQNITACNSAVINGKTYTSSQVVVDKLTTKKGCDSTITTTLIINKDINTAQNITAVNSTIINGNTYTSSQIVVDKIKAKNGCDSIVTTNLTINLPTAVEELSASEANIKVLPNPFTNELYLEYMLDEISDVTIQLFSAIGVKVFESQTNNQSTGKHRFNLTGVASTAGVYNLTLTINNKRFASRIIKLD